jgi:pheromone a factor receptor
MNFNRYLKLFVLSGIDVLCTVPFSIWALGFWFPLIPWPGWKAVHANDSYVDQITAESGRSDHRYFAALEMTRWESVTCAFIFFAFFGFAGEAIRHYKLAMQFFAKRVGLKAFTTSSSESVDVPK